MLTLARREESRDGSEERGQRGGDTLGKGGVCLEIGPEIQHSSHTAPALCPPPCCSTDVPKQIMGIMAPLKSGGPLEDRHDISSHYFLCVSHIQMQINTNNCICYLHALGRLCKTAAAHTKKMTPTCLFDHLSHTRSIS